MQETFAKDYNPENRMCLSSLGPAINCSPHAAFKKSKIKIVGCPR